MRIPMRNPENLEQVHAFETFIFPRCTAVICDKDMKLQAVEMSENDYFWMMVELKSGSDFDG